MLMVLIWQGSTLATAPALLPLMLMYPVLDFLDEAVELHLSALKICKHQPLGLRYEEPRHPIHKEYNQHGHKHSNDTVSDHQYDPRKIRKVLCITELLVDMLRTEEYSIDAVHGIYDIC